MFFEGHNLRESVFYFFISDVGRSCILVTIGGKNIMLDCGMHMGFNDDVCDSTVLRKIQLNYTLTNKFFKGPHSSQTLSHHVGWLFGWTMSESLCYKLLLHF